jgi:hypothetical protein
MTNPVDNFTIFVECAVMAPDIPKIDPDRRPDPGASAWYFRDEVLRMLFHLQKLPAIADTPVSISIPQRGS